MTYVAHPGMNRPGCELSDNTAAAVAATGRAIGAALDSLGNMSREELRDARAAKFLAIGRKV